MTNPIQMIFNYLQFSYFKCKKKFYYHYFLKIFFIANFNFPEVDNITKAADCVESFLILNPEDQSMRNNKKFYLESLKADPELFVGRPEVIAYKKRDDNEKKLLQFITENFSVFYSEDKTFESGEQMENFEAMSAII